MENDLIILGDLPLLKKSGLFSGATCPHIFKVVFLGATCPQTHTGLFSRATYPHILTLVYFQGRPAHTLTRVYFHGRPALLIGFTWDHIWRFPLTKAKFCVVRLNWDPFADPLQPEPKLLCAVRIDWDSFRQSPLTRTKTPVWLG
jgi:hypothetical protein